MSSPSEQAVPARVSRRRVFYIPGYDPFPARRYRELYRNEGAAQAAISGYEIALSPKTGPGRYGWHVTARIDGHVVATDVEVLAWSDLVQSSMGGSIAATYGAMVRTIWVYVSTGALFRLMKLRKGPVLAAFYPVVMLVVQAISAALAGWLAGSLAASGLRGMSGQTFASTFVPGFLGAAAGLAVGWAILAAFKRWDAKLFVHYLMHDYSYTARTRGAFPLPLQARISAFGETISKALEEDIDEVLVVGHSSGAHLGVSILAGLLRDPALRDIRPALGFLSLGQVVPMVSFLPEATRLRRDLHDLSQSDRLTWIDVTAPGDGCAFALCDPVAVSGVAPAVGKRWPLVFSAAFTQSLSPARWRALRWRFFRVHFQYLCAFDAPRDYDYFQITAGPMTLAERYRGRVPSRSRIEHPVNRFTRMA